MDLVLMRMQPGAQVEKQVAGLAGPDLVRGARVQRLAAFTVRPHQMPL